VTPDVPLRRILSRGDLPGSDGGIYNPGALLTDEGIVLLARREIDYRFTPIVHAERIVVDPDTLDVVAHRTLRPRGYPEGARIEDFRLIEHRGEVLAVHTLVHAGQIRPMLSRLSEGHIEPAGPMALPLPLDRIEKNWVLFEHEGALHCLYKLDPLTILVREASGSWRVVVRSDNGWADGFRGTLSNSANLIPFEGGYLGFWHSIVDRRYVQGAMLLGPDLALRSRTGVLLDGRRAVPGHKPGVLYVSSLVEHDGRILAFYGEGDAHTGVAIFDAATLADELARHPFAPAEPLTVRLAPPNMGSLFRAMGELGTLSAQADDPHIWVQVSRPSLAEVVERFGVRGMSVRDLRGRDAFDYELGEG